MVKKRTYLKKNGLNHWTDFVKKDGNYYEVVVGYADTKKDLMKIAAPYLKKNKEMAKERGVEIDMLVCETMRDGWCVAVLAPTQGIGIPKR